MANLTDKISLEIEDGTKTASTGIAKIVSDLKELRAGMANGLTGVRDLQAQLKALGVDLSKSTLKSSISTMNSDILRYVTSSNQLVTVNRKIKNGLDTYTVSLKNVNKGLKDGVSLWSAFTKGITGFIVQGRIMFDTLKSVATTMTEIVSSATQYEEALNLFTVSMGNQAEEATEWIERFSTALYLDPSNVMQYMGSLNSLISGLGVGAENSYLMSKNLTQLAYDLASFKNLSFEEAFTKLQSGISGEIEPLRNVGVALSQNTLQELANSLGIQRRVAEMSEAEKAQLRYIQILKSTSDWQGDMGRTLISPANSIRVLKEQFTLLGRAVGRIFIPMIMAAIPYVIALTQILTELANKLAAFLGYEIADIDYSGLGDISAGIGDIGDVAEDTTNKLNTMLAPFDELNVVQNQSKNAGSGLGGVGGDLGVDLPEYDALADLSEKFKENVENAKNNLSLLLDVVKYIGLAFASWKIASGVVSFMDKLQNMSMSGNLQKVFGLTLIIAGTTLIYDSANKLQKGDLSADVIFENILGTAGIAGGTFALTGGNLVLTGVSLVISLGTTLNSLFKNKDIQKELGTNGKFWTSVWAVVSKSTGNFFSYWGETISTSWNDFWSYWGAEVEEGLTDFKEYWGETLNDVKEGILQWIDDVVQWFKDLPNKIGEGISSLSEKFSDKFNEITEDISEWINEKIDWFKDLPNKIGEGISSLSEKFSDKFNEITEDISEWINEKVDWFKDLPNKIGEGISSIPDVFKEFFEKAKQNVSDIWGNITSLFSNGGQIFNGIRDGIASLFKDIVNGLISGINTIIASPFKAINKTLNGLRNTEIPVINVKPFKGLWGENPIPVPQIPKLYAEGGYPKSGEFFVARENGIPEMIGRIGNQTAVANNDQITSAITNALITALNNYNFGNNQPSTTIVNIAGRKVYEGVGDYVDSENDRYGTSYISI